jgi:hypothetical protein
LEVAGVLGYTILKIIPFDGMYAPHPASVLFTLPPPQLSKSAKTGFVHVLGLRITYISELPLHL